ncbi:hypothetical protein [Roseburia sp. MSJ-14]|uniref:hypothetical protein n=1 Tax=Roseburia sp. MSJ-14 TaxID=2841514 RepID=UPI001C1005F5|nr:hypothetical protein [Roseburia sp. MSJ-14]MBU5473951.1 hypothetical protein [Roseburia sp. MSJ-14]
MSFIGVLLVIGIGFALYCSNQERKEQEQKQEIEKYIDSMIESNNNINTKVNLIKNGTMATLGDYSYVEEQIKNISNYNIYLYNYQHNKNEYLDEYTKSQTNYNTYIDYYNYLDGKYDLNNYKSYNKTARKLIDSAKSE